MIGFWLFSNQHLGLRSWMLACAAASCPIFKENRKSCRRIILWTYIIPPIWYFADKQVSAWKQANLFRKFFMRKATWEVCPRPFFTAWIDFVVWPRGSSSHWICQPEGFEPDIAVEFEAHPTCITSTSAHIFLNQARNTRTPRIGMGSTRELEEDDSDWRDDVLEWSTVSGRRRKGEG